MNWNCWSKEKSQTIGNFFFLPTIPDSAYVSDKAFFSYVGKIPADRGFYFFSTIPDFAYIPDNRQKSVPDSPYYELGGKWKLCVLNTNVTAFIQQHWCTRAVLRRSQYLCVLALVNARFSIPKKQKLTKNTISFFFLLGQEIRDRNDSNFRETPCLLVFIYDKGTEAQQIGDW